MGRKRGIDFTQEKEYYSIGRAVSALGIRPAAFLIFKIFPVEVFVSGTIKKAYLKSDIEKLKPRIKAIRESLVRSGEDKPVMTSKKKTAKE